ncbi:MAG: ASCH domain-containing protein [Oscillospiraceae bacterium]
MKSEEMFLKYAKLNDLDEEHQTFTAWHFCNNEKDANELAELVFIGQKTATCSSHWLYEVEGEPLPQVGNFSVIENWKGNAVCIIKTTAVTLVPFDEVTAEHAFKEGEGDRSLEYWRRVHKDVYTAELADYEKEFSPKMLLVCEEFEAITNKKL